MAVMIKEPEISERFDLDVIRKIDEYNATRYENMTPAELDICDILDLPQR